MSRVASRPCRFALFVLFALLSGLILSATAHAGTITFSSPSPTPNTTDTSGFVAVSIRVQSTATIPLPQIMLIDGVPVACSGYYAEVSGHWEYDPYQEIDVWVVDEWDYTDLTLYYYTWSLLDSEHVAYVEVEDSESDVEVFAWSFGINRTPNIVMSYPSDITSSTTPAIRVIFSDNEGAHTCLLTVDGRVVPTVQVGASEFQGVVETPLADDTIVSASATVTDQGGRTSAVRNWSFRVFTAAQMTATLTPENGSNVGGWPSSTCTAYDRSPISTMDFRLDGAGPYRVIPQAIDPTHWRGTQHLGSPVDGPHTVTCLVTDIMGRTSTFSTTFTVNRAPWVYSQTPAPGSRVTSATPLIGASWFDNSTTPPTATVKIDGVVVPHTIVGSVISYRPTVPLTQEATHTVWIGVRDAASNESSSTWSFWVDRYPAMPMNACTDCHPAYPAPHQAAGCWGCHGNEHGDPDCENCHGSDYHDLSGCAGCHYTQTVYAHEDISGLPHVSSTAFESCRECHSSSLTHEHGRHTDDLGQPYDCLTCHGVAAPARVKTAITANDTRCAACHDWANHVSLHVSPTSPTCFGAGCHPATRNLNDVHALYAGPGSEHPQFANSCDLCHDNPAVNTLTSGKACTGSCHSVITHSGRPAAHAPTAASDWCTSCHGSDLDETHGAYDDLTRCAWCHERRDNWSKSGDCASCHTGEHPHPPAELTGVLANAEKLCTDCHASDLLVEHAKATSQGSGSPCDTCHAAGGPREQAGTWDLTCTDTGCHATGSARAVHENYCMACHAVAQPDFATVKTDFTAPPPVDRETACKACHLASLAGSHPYHQAGANCGVACHPGWGSTLASALPLITDFASGASFASSVSIDKPAAVLHTIHATPRWPAGVDMSVSACSSCHATAACNACHTGTIPASHSAHSASDQLANPAWTGVMSRGVIGEDQTQKTATVVSNQCASAGCHDIQVAVSRRSRTIEDFNHVMGGNPDDPASASSAVSTVGTWRARFSTRYSASRMSYSNVVGSAFTASFSGSRVEVVSDQDPYRGRAEVLIDGVVAGTFDAYASTTRFQVIVFEADIEPGAHTVTVRPLGTKQASSRGTFVVVDGFRVTDGGATVAIPTCSSCHSDKVADHTP